MKSLCIKTNNSDTITYLLNELKTSNIKNICFSENQFKNYKNVIIHYTGNDNNYFCSEISKILCFYIIDIEEENLLKRLLSHNYFYLDSNEKSKVIEICFDIISENYPEQFNEKIETLHNSFYKYILSNKSIVLDGFINFRIQEYINILDDLLIDAVNHFIIEKEYLEFISLLKLYISSQPSGCDLVHLVYSSSEAILLDKNKNLIITSNDVFKAKYLSDITFSSNDYALNTLLNLLPKKIYIHIIDNHIDDFINTLKLVFENRVNLCIGDCDICNIYKISESNFQK